MRPREISAALHLDEAACGAPKLGGEPLAAIKLRRPGRGAGEELDPVVVEGIDQVHEAARGIVHALGEHRDRGEKEGVEAARKLKIIRRAAPFAAERREIEPDEIGAAPAKRHAAAEQLDGTGARRALPASRAKLAAKADSARSSAGT